MVLGTGPRAHVVARHPGAGRRVVERARGVYGRGEASRYAPLGEAMATGLDGRFIAAQEAERRRIARDLHDVVGQGLTAIKLALQRLAEAESPGGGGRGAIDESIAIVDAVLDEVRHVALDLRPSILDDLGLVPALRWQTRQCATRGSVATRFETTLPPVRLAADVETACFRLAQEALTNVLRHSHATHATVVLRQRGGSLQLEIRDNGLGFDPRSVGPGMESLGLASMRERAALVGGRVSIVSAPGKGTRVTARFPLLTSVAGVTAG